MMCIFCGHPDTRVVDGRLDSDGDFKRRRVCKSCEKSYRTVEIPLGKPRHDGATNLTQKIKAAKLYLAQLQEAIRQIERMAS